MSEVLNIGFVRKIGRTNRTTENTGSFNCDEETPIKAAIAGKPRALALRQRQSRQFYHFSIRHKRFR